MWGALFLEGLRTSERLGRWSWERAEGRGLEALAPGNGGELGGEGVWDGPQAGKGGGLARASTSAFPILHWEKAHTNRGHSCFLLRRERDGEVGTEVKSILPKLEIGLGRGQSLRS